MELELLREQIDRIDNEILELLNKRFDYCVGVGEYKQRNNIKSVYDPKREQNIINRLKIEEEYPGLVNAIWPAIMNFSKTLQK